MALKLLCKTARKSQYKQTKELILRSVRDSLRKEKAMFLTTICCVWHRKTPCAFSYFKKHLGSVCIYSQEIYTLSAMFSTCAHYVSVDQRNQALEHVHEWCEQNRGLASSIWHRGLLKLLCLCVWIFWPSLWTKWSIKNLGHCQFRVVISR